MLIDGEKWACEACVRGHRVTTCKHHDRPLIRINRKGRPFSTCSVCHCTPCPTPDEHLKLKREASSSDSHPAATNRTSSGGRISSTRSPNAPAAFLPIAPRPASTSPSPLPAASPAYPRVSDSRHAQPSRRGSCSSSRGGYGAGGEPQHAHASHHRLSTAALDPALLSASAGHSHGGHHRAHHAHHARGYPPAQPGLYPPATLDPAQLSLGASTGGARYVPSSMPMSMGMGMGMSGVMAGSAAPGREMFFAETGYVGESGFGELDLDEVLREDWGWLDSGL